MKKNSCWSFLLLLGVLAVGCKKKKDPFADDLQSMQPAHSFQRTATSEVSGASASAAPKRGSAAPKRVSAAPKRASAAPKRAVRLLGRLPKGSIHFGFERGLQKWKGWGQGKGRRQPLIGYHKPGSLYLRNVDNRRSYTFFRSIKGLRPGRYRVSAWLRALDVKKGPWNYSIWVFFNSGKGIQSPVKSLKGTFSWRKLSFTVDLSRPSLNLWFRLKAQGQLWVDDIVIAPHRGRPIRYHLGEARESMPQANPRGQGAQCRSCYRWMNPKHSSCQICGGRLVSAHQHRRRVRRLRPRRVLFNFEPEQSRQESLFHSFREFRNRATSGRRSAVIRYGQYNNIRVYRAISNWSGYRFLALDVFNPMSQHVSFHLCVNDKKRSSYWDQLNHQARLAPGWNRLRFSLQQYVGERGSVRNQRFVNLANIQRFWFAVAPEKKNPNAKPFLVDFVRLEQGPPPPKAFSGLHRFDFVAQRFRTQPGFLGVTPLHTYHKDVGFGFRQTSIWRLLDSKYADTLLRDAILTNQGEFLVDLPNGNYIVHVYARHLGLWYEHFWTRRTITVNGKTLVRQVRRSAKAFLRDLLRFQDVEPKPSDEAYSLYLSKLLAPYTATVRVRNGRLKLRWRGDSSGIALNALILYPVSKRQRGEAFLRSLREQQKEEFSQISRKLKPLARVEPGAVSRKDRKRGFYAPLLQPSSYIRYNWVVRSRGRTISLQGGRGQRPLQSMLVRSFRRGGTLRISASVLRSGRNKIYPRQIQIRYGVNQFVGHEINHETYELAPRFLREIPKRGIWLPARQSLLVWVHIPVTKKMRVGRYRGTLRISMNGKTIRYPIRFRVLPFALPPVDIPIGYFGLNPVSFRYFKAPDVDRWIWRWQKKSLQILRERGFSTWSSLPSGRVRKQGQGIRVNVRRVDRLMRYARSLGFKHPIFTYGGSFLDALLKIDSRYRIYGMPQAQYRRASARTLRRLLSTRSWLPIVYNYSDEASGYSQKVQRDLKRASLLSRYYPFLRRGGFSHSIARGKYGYKLNLTMTDISLSSVKYSHIRALRKQKKRWGLYNSSVGPFDPGRATFGEGLFAARQQGASHRLAWYWSGIQNYPYYDLDGRESDAMMVYPRTDGRLDIALKLEWATQGLEDYRLLLLLQQLARRAGAKGRPDLMWMAQHYRDVNFFGLPNYTSFREKRRTDASSKAFRRKIYARILRLLR